MPNSNDWLLLLKKVSLFSSLTEKELSLIIKRMTLASFPKGALLVEQNKPGDTFFLIVSGSAQLVKKNPDAKNHTDKELTMAYVSRGDALGEVSLFTNETYGYTARIISTADVLILKKSDFDQILESYPKLAIHVTRRLSSHLAALKGQGGEEVAPGKILSMIAAIPARDQILFSVNFGISLVEQTRQKTLLLMIDDGSGAAAKSLGLDPPSITLDMIRDGCFRDPKKFDSVINVHPSGLEVLSLPVKTFHATDSTNLNALISQIKDSYDYALVVLPVEFNEGLFTFVNEAHNVIFVTSPDSPAKDLEVHRRTEQALPDHKPKERIWLMTQPNGVPANIPTGNRIPWDKAWGRNFMVSGSPFVPFHAVRTLRKIDRLARYFGGRLVGFAMGSGAAFGYSIIGILRVLEREGIYPDVCAGTSMGALIGSFYSSGKSPDELEEIAKSITKKRLWKMIHLAFPRTGLLTGRGILAFLRSHLGDSSFQNLEIPFACVATDIQTGREIVLDEGNVAEAVRASLSLPVFFQPYYSNGRYLVDGGLVNPVPNSIIMSQGANILLSANLTSKATSRKVPRMMGWRKRLPTILRGPSLPTILMKTIYTMQYEIAEARSKLAHVVMEINAQGLWWWDLDQANEIIRLGEAAAEENLPKIKSFLPYFSDSCKVRLTHRGRKIY